jgi:hypothetical protein
MSPGWFHRGYVQVDDASQSLLPAPVRRSVRWNVAVAMFAVAAVACIVVAILYSPGGHPSRQACEKPWTCIAPEWTSPPTNTPTSPANFMPDGPFCGNGDLGAVVGAAPRAPHDITVYVDANQLHCPSSASGNSVCGYGTGGHVGVGLLGLDVWNGGLFLQMKMTQHIDRGIVAVSYRYDSGTLLVNVSVQATANIVFLDVAWTDAVRAIEVQLTTAMHDTGRDMACRRNRAGRGNCTGDGCAAWQWAYSEIGRGYQDTRGLPSRMDAHPLTQRMETVAMGTVFTAGFRTPPFRVGASVHGFVPLRPGQRVVLPTAVWFGRDFAFARDPLDAVAASAKALADPAYVAGLRLAHDAWWAAYWDLGGFHMPSALDLEDFWYGSAYMWATANRYNETAHLPPPGLWRNTVTGNTVLWSGFTTDLNTVAPYFGAYGANRVDVPRAMHQLYIDAIPAARAMAQANGCPGVLIPVEIGARGSLVVGLEDQGMKWTALLGSLLFIWHYEHTLDDDWLRNTAYPYLREVADFWTCYLYWNTTDERTHVLNDCCYETCLAMFYKTTESSMGISDLSFQRQDDPTSTLSYLRRLFGFLLDTASITQVDSDDLVVWQRTVRTLADFPVASVGGNTSVFADFVGAGLPPRGDLQMLGSVQAIYPGETVSSSMLNASMIEAARATMDYVQWYNAPSDGFCIMYTAAARLEADQSTVFPQFRRQLAAIQSTNLVTNAQIGPGAVQSINEYFLQSHEPFVRLYPAHFSVQQPAAPETTPWLGSSFWKLRARGAFLVSGSLSSAGVVGAFTVFSEKGGPFVFLTPWPDSTNQIVVKDIDTGLQLPVTPYTVTSAIAPGPVYIVPTNANQTFAVWNV